jgi:hypothetical protein
VDVELEDPTIATTLLLLQAIDHLHQRPQYAAHIPSPLSYPNADSFIKHINLTNNKSRSDDRQIADRAHGEHAEVLGESSNVSNIARYYIS